MPDRIYTGQPETTEDARLLGSPSTQRLPQLLEIQMPGRIYTGQPETTEDARLLAQAVADLHYTLGIVVENAEYLVPGEAVQELRDAWMVSERFFQELVNALLEAANLVTRPDPIAPYAFFGPAVPLDTLEANGLTGAVGHAKRSLLNRLKDGFWRFWDSLPRTVDKQQKAMEAGADYLEYGATVASSIPGFDVVEKVLLLGKHLLSVRARRQD